ncbi:uncharacterized protein LOC121807774 [Salvia splendens]|uniref:uncharacterized protein LOC121807774 n=1 Tax=Salvia splendens TaxID=180675 RepID=UPI001C266FA0|nr:uncharacterized protein LOC121807774 [Salvia splendens]
MLPSLRVIAVVTIFISIYGIHARNIPGNILNLIIEQCDRIADDMTINGKTSSHILGFVGIMRKGSFKGLDGDGSIESAIANNVFRPPLPSPPPPRPPPGPRSSVSPFIQEITAA